jgi:hypothetical protein
LIESIAGDEGASPQDPQEPTVLHILPPTPPA